MKRVDFFFKEAKSRKRNKTETLQIKELINSEDVYLSDKELELLSSEVS